MAGFGSTETGYVIRFNDTESAGVARNNTQWLIELGNITKIVKPLFGIVVHCTPTEDLDLEHAREQAIEKILNEKTGNSESRK